MQTPSAKAPTIMPPLKSVKEAYDIVNALRNPTKRGIIEHILLVGTENVTELAIRARMQHSQMSQHVGKLRRLGILVSERLGQEVYYSVVESELDRIQSLLNKLNQVQK